MAKSKSLSTKKSTTLVSKNTKSRSTVPQSTMKSKIKAGKPTATSKKTAKKVTAVVVDNHDDDQKLNHEQDQDHGITALKDFGEPEQKILSTYDLTEAEEDNEPESDNKPNPQLPSLTTSKAISTTTDPIQLYLNEIKKYPLLSREDELEYAKKYHETKDPKLAQILVTSNLRFVVKVAAEYSKFGARMIDLVQEGNMGLMHAVRDFNPYKGVRLITYAVWWIRGYIMEYLMKQYSLVKIGTTQNQKKLFYQLQKEKEALEALGDSPNLALISSRLGIPEDEVKDMAGRLSGRDVSLNAPLDDESKTSLMDMQSEDRELPDVSLAKKEEVGHLTEAIEAIRDQLNEKEKIILEERLLSDEPLTLQEIGEKYKITREAVRQAEARLMKKIKDEFLKKNSE